MKKNLLIIYFLACIASLTHAQNVPNGGFESWTAGEPDSWTTNNIPGLAVFVTQTSPGNSGASAARGEVMTINPVVIPPSLTSSDNTGNGFPVTQPYGTMSCYYKFNSVSGDILQVTVVMMDASGNGVAAGGTIINSSAATFTLLNLPIYYVTQNPAKCIIQFSILDTVTGSGHLGSYFIVDDVGLSGMAGISEINTVSGQTLSLLPNPASLDVTINYSVTQKGDAQFSMIDIAGKEVKNMTLTAAVPGNHVAKIDVSALKEGFYLCRLITEESVTVKRMEVRH